jgi:hypothetical protein
VGEVASYEKESKLVTMDTPLSFGGNPGDQVPQVNPDDFKAVWSLYEDIAKRTKGSFSVDEAVIARSCSVGADVRAVSYRVMWLQLVPTTLPDDLLAQWIKRISQPEIFYRVAAEVPMTWVGVGVDLEGPPFDVEEFLRRLNEVTEKGAD